MNARSLFSSAGVGMIMLLLSAGTPAPALADVHLIYVNEYYTQCDDGSTDIQYIELKPASTGQFFRQCASIQVKRTVGGADLFFAKPVFVGHTDGETFPRTRHFLIATPAFQAKTGVVPDLTIPNGTLNKAGGVIRFAADSGCAFNWGTIHEVRYGDQGTAPAPGPNQAAHLNTMTFTFSLGTPSPTNFSPATAAPWTCVVSSVPDPTVLPTVLALAQNWPNPFRTATTIQFDLPEPGTVVLEVYGIAGRRVRTLEYGHHEQGRFTTVWDGTGDDGRAVTPGIYFFRLEALGRVETRRAIVLR